MVLGLCFTYTTTVRLVTVITKEASIRTLKIVRREKDITHTCQTLMWVDVPSQNLLRCRNFGIKENLDVCRSMSAQWVTFVVSHVAKIEVRCSRGCHAELR